MNIQDLNGIRNVQDLMRRFNFSKILGFEKNIQTNSSQIVKVNTSLNEFMTSTNKNLESMQTQIDGKIETFYFGYDPTLENEPFSLWKVEDYDKHLGDLFFNIFTKQCFRFMKESSNYLWQKLQDEEIQKALDDASKAQDTADGKRTVFIVQPIPPYNSGDLWINNKEIYICNVSRLTGNYIESDWNNSLKYTDDTSLNDFVTKTYTAAMNNLTNQIDGKSENWFYNGIPTLSDLPASNWDTDEEKIKHLDDTYYDKDTGYVYIFEKNNDLYQWTRTKDKDITEAMSSAAAAQDTADGKRTVFIVQPIPPYNSGDLWINNKEIYICQISRIGGSFSLSDWVHNLKYTDDTVANAVVDELGGTVTTVLQGMVVQQTEKWVKFIDLETGGSTVISGDNIKTGHLNTDNVTIGNDNVIIDDEGIKLNNGAKLIGGAGVLSNLHYKSFGMSEINYDVKSAGEYNWLGFMYNDVTSSDKYDIYIDCNIPENFIVTKAYITLKHISQKIYRSDSSFFYGYARNIKIYNANLENTVYVSGQMYSEYYPNFSGITFNEISNVFNTSNNMYTPSIPNENNLVIDKIISNDISSVLTKSTRIKIATTNSTPATDEACLAQTGFIAAQLDIYGYIK